MEIIFLRDCLRLLNSFFLIHKQAFFLLNSKNQILSHCQGWHEHHVLMHHTDPILDRFLAGMEMDLFAVQENLPAGNLLNSEQHLHERGFSSAVFSDQGMNLPFIYTEINVVICQNTARVNFCQVLHP